MLNQAAESRGSSTQWSSARPPSAESALATGAKRRKSASGWARSTARKSARSKAKRKGFSVASVRNSIVGRCDVSEKDASGGYRQQAPGAKRLRTKSGSSALTGCGWQAESSALRTSQPKSSRFVRSDSSALDSTCVRNRSSSYVEKWKRGNLVEQVAAIGSEVGKQCRHDVLAKQQLPPGLLRVLADHRCDPETRAIAGARRLDQLGKVGDRLQRNLPIGELHRGRAHERDRAQENAHAVDGVGVFGQQSSL